MLHWLTICGLLIGVVLFARLSFADFAKVLQPLVVALSIMSAALLVRLNRGMPTLDWKSLEPTERKQLTEKISNLTREYAVVLAIHGVTLGVLLALAASNGQISVELQRGMLTLAGGLLALCVSRMSYIVWRDYDIVRLQKKLVDDSADRDAIETAQKEAADKISNIRATSLRSGTKPEVKSWGE